MKTECTFFVRHNSYACFSPQLIINNVVLHLNDCTKLLGVYLDKKFHWKHHIEQVVEQCGKILNTIKAAVSASGEQTLWI